MLSYTSPHCVFGCFPFYDKISVCGRLKNTRSGTTSFKSDSDLDGNIDCSNFRSNPMLSMSIISPSMKEPNLWKSGMLGSDFFLYFCNIFSVSNTMSTRFGSGFALVKILYEARFSPCEVALVNLN